MPESPIDSYLAILKNRIEAYRNCFDLSSFENQAVLRDLALFCRMFTTTVDPKQEEDPLILEGRRQVFLRIQEYLQFDYLQLYQLHPLKHITTQLTPGTLTTGISETRIKTKPGGMNG